MFNVAICLNNREYMQEIETILKNIMLLETTSPRIFKFYTGDELLIALSNDHIPFHLVFLDTNLPDRLGLQLATNIQKFLPNVEFIFISDSYDALIDAFQFNLKNYFKTPIDFSQLKQALQIYLSKKLERNYLEIKNKNLYRRISFPSIISIESYGRTVTITTNENEQITTYYNMENLEKALPADTFIRCHKSYIINIDYISSISNNSICTTTKTTIPIGRIYKHRLTEAFGNL